MWEPSGEHGKSRRLDRFKGIKNWCIMSFSEGLLMPRGEDSSEVADQRVGLSLASPNDVSPAANSLEAAVTKRNS